MCDVGLEPTEQQQKRAVQQLLRCPRSQPACEPRVGIDLKEVCSARGTVW